MDLTPLFRIFKYINLNHILITSLLGILKSGNLTICSINTTNFKLFNISNYIKKNCKIKEMAIFGLIGLGKQSLNSYISKSTEKKNKIVETCILIYFKLTKC